MLTVWARSAANFCWCFVWELCGPAGRPPLPWQPPLRLTPCWLRPARAVQRYVRRQPAAAALMLPRSQACLCCALPVCSAAPYWGYARCVTGTGTPARRQIVVCDMASMDIGIMQHDPRVTYVACCMLHVHKYPCRFYCKAVHGTYLYEGHPDYVHVTVRACITIPRQLMHSAAVQPSTHTWATRFSLVASIWPCVRLNGIGLLSVGFTELSYNQGVQQSASCQ